MIGPTCQRAVIAWPVAASSPIPAAKASQKPTAITSSLSRARIARPPPTMIASARASQVDIGPHQKSSGSVRPEPRIRKQRTSPMLDGLKTWPPRGLEAAPARPSPPAGNRVACGAVGLEAAPARPPPPGLETGSPAAPLGLEAAPARPSPPGLETGSPAAPQGLITYLESSETAAVAAKIHQPRRLHQSPCSVPSTRRMNATPLPVRSALAGHMIARLVQNTIPASRTAEVPSATRIWAIERRKSKAI